MFMKDNQIRDTVRSASVRELFYDVVSSVYPVGVWEHQAHLLQWFCVNRPSIAHGNHQTFENCSSFELGSLEVVIRIFGSIIPAL